VAQQSNKLAMRKCQTNRPWMAGAY